MMNRISFTLLALTLTTTGLLLAGCAEEQSTDDQSFVQESRIEAQKASANPPVAGDIQPTTNVPVIELESDTYDMGTIAPAGLTHAEMKVFNRGDAPLTISRITTTCGCTTGAMRNSVIPPGESEILKITVDPARVHGFYTMKTLTVASNDPKNPFPTIDVHTRVQPEAEFTPQEFIVGDVKHGEGSVQTGRIVQLQDYPLTLTAVEVMGNKKDYVSASYEEVPESEWTTPGKREFILTAKLLPEAPPGAYKEAIYVHSNLKRQPGVALSFEANVFGNYRMSTNRVELRNAEPETTYPSTLTITSEEGLEILGFESSNENIKVNRRSGEEANSFVFDVELPGDATSRLQRDQWRIKLKAGDTVYDDTVDVVVIMKKAG